eukprot:jgi/Galph1/3137/GphlegSOOS_G1813.1
MRQLRRLERQLEGSGRVAKDNQQDENDEKSIVDLDIVNPARKNAFQHLQFKSSSSEEQVKNDASKETSTATAGTLWKRPTRKKKTKKGRVESKQKTLDKQEHSSVLAEGSGIVHSHPNGTLVKCLPKPFWVQPSLLNSRREIRKLFGTSVTRLQQSEGTENNRRPHLRNRRLAISKNKSLIVSPQEDWCRTPKDLRLVFKNEDFSGCKWFQYEFLNLYESCREEFENIVQLGDPSLLVDFLNRHPYHVEALLRLSESCMWMGEPERSVNLLERALYLLEGAWPPNFKPFDGKCRLKYHMAGNSIFFVALFRYTHALCRRGLYSTSFQVAKLLFNLDWENDPMGVLLYIDTLALLAHDYHFVVDTYESTEHVKLCYLPNYKFNYALAKHFLGHDDASVCLQEAILTFPQTFLQMVQDCKITIDESYLYTIENNIIYVSLKQPNDEMMAMDILEKMAHIFVAVGESVWKLYNVKEWLCEGIVAACSLIENDSTFLEQCTSTFKKACEYLSSNHLFGEITVADFVQDSSGIPAHIIQQPFAMGHQEAEREEEESTQNESFLTNIFEMLFRRGFFRSPEDRNENNERTIENNDSTENRSHSDSTDE